VSYLVRLFQDLIREGVRMQKSTMKVQDKQRGRYRYMRHVCMCFHATAGFRQGFRSVWVSMQSVEPQ